MTMARDLDAIFSRVFLDMAVRLTSLEKASFQWQLQALLRLY